MTPEEDHTESESKHTSSMTLTGLREEQERSEKACSKVFGIPELADQILLDLPLQDVICAMRVCRQWQKAIRSSDRVQELLFMKPISTERVYLVPSQSPRTAGYIRHHWAEIQRPGIARTVLENPFLALLCHEDLRSEAFTRPEASWRPMLITQPPIGNVEFTTDMIIYNTKFVSGGITLGHVDNGDPLASIDGWSVWCAYDGSYDQLKRLKADMKSNSETEARNEADDHDDLWWMPDEYLSGI